jgi:hypothetical protein
MNNKNCEKTIFQKKPLFFFLRRAGGLIVFVGLQVLVLLVLLEIAGRAFDPFGISYYPETARYLDTLVLEEPIGYRNRPGLTGTFYGAPVSINSIGLRDREVSFRPDEEFRILVMGDSVPFGIGVAYENSLPHQLERVLNEQRPGRHFRTFNMGVPSYNTEQELIQLKSIGLKLEPDAVVLLFSDNDIEPKMWVLNKRSRWYVNLAQRSYAASLLFAFVRELREHIAVPEPSSAHVGISGIAGVRVNMSEYRVDSSRWQAIDRSLSEINALLRKRNIPFVLFTNGSATPVINLLQGVAAREGFPLVNLHRNIDPRWAGQDEARFHNSRFDPHPSPLGNKALATLFAENIIRLKASERK